MSLMKRGLLMTVITALPLVLFLLALNFAVLSVAGNPAPVKRILKESGVYKSATDTFLQATDNPGEESTESLSADNPLVREAFRKAFPPELIENSAEDFIDSIYSWLSGETQVPDFRIDLTEAKASFINEVAAGAEARAASLPPCPAGQAEFNDPLSAACLPRGVPPSAAADKIRQEIAGQEEGFLANPVLTANSIKSSHNPSETTFANNRLPDVYQNLKDGKLVLLLLALIMSVAVILLSPTLRSGIRRTGIILLTVGVLILLGVFITDKAVSQALPDMLSKTDNPALAEKLQTLLSEMVEESNRSFATFGAVYSISGAGAILGSVFIRRSKNSSLNADGPPSAQSDAVPSKPANPSKSPSAKRKVVKIQ